MLTRFSSDMVMMTALTTLGLTGILDSQQALAGFSNAGLITVAAMLVIAAGIRESGGVDWVVDKLLGTPKNYPHALFKLLVPVLPLSAFLNNTPVVATLVPAVSQWSDKIHISPSKLLIPLSYFSILGGTVTLIGTSTNLVVNGQYQALTGKPGFGLFAITALGLPLALIGSAFIILVLSWLLPNRKSVTERFANRREFTFEVAVAVNGPLEGLTVAEAGLRALDNIYLVEIERHGSIVTAVPSEEKLQGGDRLVFVGETQAIVDLLKIEGLTPSHGDIPVIEQQAPERCLVEAVVSPHCDGIGMTIRGNHFRDRYGAVVLAVARDGEAVQGNLGSISLQASDVLLLEARPAFVTRQRVQRDFILINDQIQQNTASGKAGIAWVILALVIALAAMGVVKMLYAALAGAGLMIFSGCLSVGTARRSLDLNVLVTIAASFALGNAMLASGAANYIADNMLALANGQPWLLLALTYATVSILTEIITNNAAAVLMLPVVLALTETLHLNPEPFVLTTMMAASASFATPIGYQTNLMVYGPGGYHFNDFLKVGIPMNIMAGLVTVGLAPIIWPFQG
ncbi:MAG: SLC13 family permease [Methylococcales bacterium]|nr:SLC13 family permease [Methylococcales bacterium]